MTTMKTKKKSSLIAASAVLLAVMMTATACGSDKANSNGNEQGSSVEQPANASPENTSNNTTDDNTGNSQSEGQNNGVMDPGTASPDTDASTVPDDSAVKTNEGTFVGQADTTSVEIDLPDGPMVLQFTDELTDKINSIPPDTKVQFEYTEKVSGDVTQYLLKKLEVKS
ncbi:MULTISPECIES: hypothetical protein [unclassified Paenibacillus]|uniref:hypothetical protein n=1 Tax=unclassified Paenibacillus TaxID=185978 RepID=UPI00104B2D62|nr:MULTISPECIES: hypothetical protein [unclassified Paenibacillus]NIK66681.1 hypothetical protein [Paenibacillus sp. BK720]TCN00660.1 hypothetical protein EV294_101108 [Paenibacillus sp. BK033]